MTLYEITGEILELQDMLEDADVDEQAFADTMEAVMGDFESKADDYGKVIRNLEATADSIAAEVKRLQGRKKTIENNIKRMKEALKDAMVAVNKKSIDGELFKFTLRNNPPQLPEDIPFDKIPYDYYIPQEPKLDKKLLLKGVKSGEVEGIELKRTQSVILK